jgi:hypothetical protein
VKTWPIMEQLSGSWADVLAMAAVLAAIAACAGLVTRIGGHRRLAPPVTEAAPVSEAPEPSAIDAPRRLDRAQEWALVIGHATRGLERGPAVAALQSKAALKIAAAEHAFNRLVADYAMLRPISATPTGEPPREIAGARGRLRYARQRTPERRRLAA